jgi:ABC-type antimicrobial peptide transport system permease subunit
MNLILLFLAGLGLYGVTSYSINQRRPEIGIRVALLVGLGLAIGTGVSLLASKFVASLLYGLTPRDPVMLVGAACILAAVGAVAGWLPAWRASQIGQSTRLRSLPR